MSLRASQYLSTTRVVVFSTTLLFSLIVMSVSADLISITSPGYFKFSALALATALLTFTVAIMLVIDFLRQGSIFSYVATEIIWLSILWVFWLSTGSYAAWTDGQLSSANPDEASCDFQFGFFNNPTASQMCHEIKAIMAFSFLIWILLMSYTVALLVLAIRAQERGNSAWTTGVRDGVLFYSVRSTTGGSTQVLASSAPPTIPFSVSESGSPPVSQQQQPLPQPSPSEPPSSQQPYSPYPSSYPMAQV